MKTLDDAVIELNGVLPPEPHPDSKLSDFKGTYYVFEDEVRAKVVNGHIVYNELVGKVSEFQQRAKELGFVGKYRWGVEYPTNGKKPDLADNVLISVAGKFINGNWYMHEFTTFGVDWEDSIKFKITDPRYKPADTSYLNNNSLAQVSDTDVVESDWYDYEKQTALRFPSVGTECFYFHDGLSVGQKVSVLEIHKDEKLATISLSGVEIHNLLFCARVWQLVPLDHATRKAEAEKKRVVKAVINAYDKLREEAGLLQAFNKLYDKGYLRLPTEKN